MNTKIKTNKDIFFEYLNTADIVYKNDNCITDMSTHKHRCDMLITDIEDVAINPNHTFTVYFKNGDKDTFELYTMKGHYQSTDNVDIDIIVKHSNL